MLVCSAARMREQAAKALRCGLPQSAEQLSHRRQATAAAVSCPGPHHEVRGPLLNCGCRRTGPRGAGAMRGLR